MLLPTCRRLDILGSQIDLIQYDGMSSGSPAAFRISLEPRFEGVGKVLEEFVGKQRDSMLSDEIDRGRGCHSGTVKILT